MLRDSGVLGWRHTLADLTTETTTTDARPPTAAPRTQAASLPPTPVAAELVHVLAALALAGT